MKCLPLGFLAAACLATSAGAEVRDTSADQFVTHDEVVVQAAPKAAWLALISPGDWWSDDHTWSGTAANLSITPQGGGCFCERIPESEGGAGAGLAGSAQHMTVVMAHPMKVLRMRGALGPLQSEPVDGVLTVTLQPDKDTGGTKIVWQYVVGGAMRFPVETIAKSVDSVMSQQLALLAARLGRVAGPAAKPAGNPLPSEGDDIGEALDAMGRAGAATDR